jgi:hypothetical protein
MFLRLTCYSTTGLAQGVSYRIAAVPAQAPQHRRNGAVEDSVVMLRGHLVSALSILIDHPGVS